MSLYVRLSAGLAIVATILGACASGGPAATGTPRPTPTPPTPAPVSTPTPTPTPDASPSGAVVVTFEVVDETYRVLLTDAADIAIAQLLLAGEEAPAIPSGLIVRGETGVNTGYSWSIDPESVEFADVTIELCDGLPSFVEDGTLSGDRFCPWSAEVVAIEPAD